MGLEPSWSSSLPKDLAFSSDLGSVGQLPGASFLETTGRVQSSFEACGQLAWDIPMARILL